MPLPVTARGFSWRHADRVAPAVGPLDLDIAAGERVLLLGPSGSGKSTLLHAIAGVLPAESGEARGEILLGDAPPDPGRGEVGVVFQDPDAQVVFSRVGDDVAFGMENLGMPAAEIEPRIASALPAMGLDLDHDHPTAALSGGQKQRLALAGILAMAPQILVLDEPTANIDPESTAGIRDAVLRMQAETGATMIVVEHRVDLWIDHVDTVIVLGPDGVLVEGPPRRILGDPELSDVLERCGIRVPGAVRALGQSRRAHSPAEAVLGARSLAVARPGACVPAARDLDLTVHAGEAVGIVGPNGAGKSTTALTLAGLIPEFAGEVAVQGRLARGAKHSRPFRWSSRFLAPRIGSVFQEPDHQFLRATVAEELALGPRLAGWTAAEVEARVSALLLTLGLADRAEAHPQGLSGGEKRRLSVAAMLAPRPAVLVVDEPTFGQDALTWAGLVDLFLEVLDHGCAVIAVSHDLEFLDAIGARRVGLGAGAPRRAADPVHALRGETVE
ncbi:energy-coupling factor transport system ATP-binding protein [Brevibacterium sanguinis]|uniref:Energy-coupling factor transport system ATP-binding protein n=2 Tax=Brevibacterium TaxID=1696 RepID=A0A366IEJ8_9MICO|nr:MULTISPECIES: ATP-binding cassette domain-containing protein [Brevibacterium]RBP63134.1 energy-coupling factor transport system ATP-binding protein [Brevibacterium sanguinis]RBP69690.1 energy-coupling factor transport system ATP-binding protein [Brevibacterium celere]